MKHTKEWRFVISKHPMDLIQSHGSEKVKQAFDILVSDGLQSEYLRWYTGEFKKFVFEETSKNFWPCFQELSLQLSDLDDESQRVSRVKHVFEVTFTAIHNLYNNVRRWLSNPVIEQLFESQSEKRERFYAQCKLNFRAAFQWEIQIKFSLAILLSYSYGFQLASRTVNKSRLAVFGNLNSSSMSFKSDKSTTDECDLCARIEDFSGPRLQNVECFCESMMDEFIQMNYHLRELTLLEMVATDAISSVIHRHIEAYIKDNCKGNFEISFLKKLEAWVKEIVVGWLNVIYRPVNDNFLPSMYKERFIHFIYETYATYRVDQMFDIIVEYPESEAALKDLKKCFEKCTGYRKRVIHTLKKSFELRLLHPGVATNDILTAYIQAIKALRILDPSGVILHLVCDPVKKYLKKRDDTVRCIITALTDESSELIPELARNTTAPVDEGNQSDDEYICEHWQKWTPDPVDAGYLTNTSKSLRTSDIVSILVNVYESKDLFVEEYQRLLAQKFLSSFNCNVENERRNLELLTLRFGESDLDACEVMLQDMSSSKRIDARINSGEIQEFVFDEFPIRCLVISAEFWPENLGILSEEEMAKYRHVSGDEEDNSKKMRLPENVHQGIECYTKSFETIRANRTLFWIYSLGQVELELEFTADKTMSFTVSPVHAAIICLFQERNTWSVSELSQKLGIATTILRRKIIFWQNKSVLKEITNDLFVLIDEDDQSDLADLSSVAMSEDGEAELRCASEDEMLESEDDA